MGPPWGFPGPPRRSPGARPVPGCDRGLPTPPLTPAILLCSFKAAFLSPCPARPTRQPPPAGAAGHHLAATLVPPAAFSLKKNQRDDKTPKAHLYNGAPLVEVELPQLAQEPLPLGLVQPRVFVQELGHRCRCRQFLLCSSTSLFAPPSYCTFFTDSHCLPSRP